MNGAGGSGSEEGDEEEAEEDTEPTSDSEEGVVGADLVDTRALYLVTSLLQNDAGEPEDLHLVELRYDVAAHGGHTFQLFGTEISHPTIDCAHAADSSCESLKSLKGLAEADGLRTFALTLNPTGDFMRRLVSPHTMCPANCNDGWLDSLASLSTVLPTSVYATLALLEHRPICPVCLGLKLLKKQQALRSTLEQTMMPDVVLGPAIEFSGKLNRRRTAVGYEFYQFDEREWGLMFDDMLSEDGDDAVGAGGASGGDGFQAWEEAMDPANNVVTRPASASVIAALPRMKYSETVMKESAGEKPTKCLVCQDEYVDDRIVAQLPCSHFSCDGPCTEQWLGQFARCPQCSDQVLLGAFARELEGKASGGKEQLHQLANEGTMLAALDCAAEGESEMDGGSEGEVLVAES